MVNRLANEPSPYLRQHASNPVDWWPWGPEALAEAARLDRPLLISVGYSACHWCHVMAHESFEDAETAALMNELFVNVKVDREERPDVDAVYMEATQAMTGSGGWPMTVFATPAGEPFFCGTYFPPRSLPGRPSFTEVCTAVASAWRDQRGDLLEQATRLTEHLQPADLRGHEPPGVGIINDAIQRLLSTLDPHNGGFGTAPKFPQPLALDLLLSHAAHTGDQLALDGVCRALDAMAAGGIHDHLAGGFARYSVDPIWLVPHFEKMLYDQALLLRVYTHAWQLTAETRYAWVAERIVDYLLTYLRSPQGGFYSAEDADSEGVEGKFYVWTPDQITAAIADHLPDAREASETATAAIEFWGVSNDGNFEGATILNRITHPDSLVGDERVETARKALLVERDTRVRPGLDDKVLTEWNALAVAALADAAAVFERDDWLAAAVTASHFLLDSLRDGDGRWLRAWQAEAGARHRAYASDHAALVDAFTRVAEATGDPTWLQEAATVAEELLEHFVDPDGGGLYTTAHDAEALVARPRDIQDGALPSATANAAFALQRLGALTGDHRYGSTAADLLRLTGRFVGAHPLAFPLSAQALTLLQRGVTQVVVAGDAPELVAAVRARWHPGVVLLWGTPGDSPLWQGRRPGVDAGQTPRAYVCHDQVCELPTDSPEELAAQLNGL